MTTEPKTLEGQVAVVTGAGRGIGAATALLLARRGAKVALAARTEHELVTVARRVSELEGTALPVTADVTDEAQVGRLFREVRERLGPVDILVNNAGTVVPAKLAETSLADYKKQLDANLTATFLCTRAALEDMLSRKRGRIVNVASVAGMPGVQKYPGFAVYAAAKAGVMALTEALAQEVGDAGVRVSCVSPAATETDLFRSVAPPDVKAQMSPDDVARTIVWLCSPDASPINGANLAVWGR